jgi:hypothetical protein
MTTPGSLITACCPKIPAVKKRLKSRGVTEISATSPPSSISQLGNVGNSRASKLLAIFTAIKFQSVVTMSETQTPQVSVIICFSYSSPHSPGVLTLVISSQKGARYSKGLISGAELQSGVWIHTCSRRTCPSATTRACDRGCHATLPLTGLHKR